MRKFSDCLAYDSSKPSTPTSECSPLSQSSSFNKQRKKPSLSVDYDINNIIIPYSIAASTRLERIQYKEIPTPGWRNINEFQEDDENNEDVSWLLYIGRFILIHHTFLYASLIMFF